MDIRAVCGNPGIGYAEFPPDATIAARVVSSAQVQFQFRIWPIDMILFKAVFRGHLPGLCPSWTGGNRLRFSANPLGLEGNCKYVEPVGEDKAREWVTVGRCKTLLLVSMTTVDPEARYRHSSRGYPESPWSASHSSSGRSIWNISRIKSAFGGGGDIAVSTGQRGAGRALQPRGLGVLRPSRASPRSLKFP